MRPLTLTMQAFGSYGKPETIDFTELGDQRLFLIHGPTGSGKTTILDAICFALYGVATGDDRDAKDFRSDFSSQTETTEVTLDFAIGDRHFRIIRQPEQERAKKRGDGVTRSAVAATMWERTSVGDDEEGIVLAGKWSEVTAKVEELLGFRSEQFRQVIVLPQGRFRDLLMASSKDREEILQQLFDTSFYRKIQISLKERAKSLSDDINEQRTRRSVLLDQSDCEDETDVAELLTELAKDLEGQEKVAKETAVKSKAAEKALTKAASIEKRFALQDEIAAAMADFEKQTKTINVERKRLKSALKAAALSDFFAAVKQARTVKDAAATSLTEAQDNLKEKSGVQVTARKDLKAQKERESERKALESKLSEFKRIRPLIADLARERNEKDKVKQKFDVVDESLNEMRKGKSDLKKDYDQTDAKIKDARKKLRDRELLEIEVKEAEKRQEASGALARSRNKVASAKKELETHTATEKERSKQLKKRRTHLQQLIEQRQAGSAAMLAKELQPGDPCPVCGSTEHPHTATSDAAIPDDEAVDKARLRVEAAADALEIENQQVVQAGKLHARLKGELETLLKSGDKLDATNEELKTAVRVATEKLKENDQLSILVEKKSANLAEVQKALKKNEAAIDGLQKKHNDLGKRLSAVKAALAEKEKSAGGDFKNAGAVDSAAKEAQEILKKSRKALEEAVEKERTASSEVVEAETARKHARKVKTSTEKEAVTKDKAWQGRLEKAGFKSEKEFLASDLVEESRNELDSKIEAYDRDYGEAKVRAKDITAELKDKHRPDIDALQETANEFESAKSQADETVASIREKTKGLTQTQKDLKKLGKELSTLEEEFGVLGTLARTADGQNPLKVSLQRFVLATRLDDVLAAASERLSMMTKGRFRIQRNTAADDKRSAGGLELEVEDAYTGSCRPVSTLSGGESFQAALSLALGLAEVVQVYAGGIRLDTIFVDEGFGSLDPEALELAINTLIDLQATGRLVGVISHVPELKERIDVRLQIKAGKSGSTTAFQLP